MRSTYSSFCITLMMGVFAMFAETGIGYCQAARSPTTCSKPVILDVLPNGTSGIRYAVDGRQYQYYPLTELAKALNLCGEQRQLFVVADSRIPVGEVPGSVMSKLQAEHVRYFIRYPKQRHVFVEIKIVAFDSKLP